ncbi:cytochrome c oxidase accessory protein CcoG [Halopseudomonas pachastrellae]|nr:cytochrome c oxidase accessory protein CcoG [Halopseudomonas pachastrellae]
MTSHIPLKDLTPAQQGGPIHTRSFKGLYRNLRLLGAGALMLLFFGTAWIDWNGQQAVLWDLDSKQFHIFGATFWPQDFILLSAILMIAAFGLFFITVVAGRIWCGYSCPQSVWTWIFMWVEKVTEGERHQRIRLDAAPWSLNKLLRRSAKHGLWLAISLATAIGFIGYFIPVRELVGDLLSWQVGATTAFWLLCFTAATYFNAGWLREKVACTCARTRVSRARCLMPTTLLVTYDAARGETRGPRKKNTDPAASGLGDCVDCTVCVQVCPTGIDIRDGLQIDCISCGPASTPVTASWIRWVTSAD